MLGGMTRGDSCPSTGGVIRMYQCRHFGVSANAVLDTGRRYATVTLSGIVLGGRIEGNGWLGTVGADRAKADDGLVILDPDFEERLQRRGITVRYASLNQTSDTLVVTVTIPIFGVQSIVLHRAPLSGTVAW